MLRLCSVRCPHMNQITLEDTLDALRYNQYEINVPEDDSRACGSRRGAHDRHRLTAVNHVRSMTAPK